ALELLGHAAEELGLADLAQQELEARLLPVLALAVAEEHAHHRVAGGEELAYGHEVAEEVRDLRRRPEAARHVEAEPAPRVRDGRDSADVVDQDMREVGPAARQADLEFSRELPVVLVKEEVLRDGVRVRRHVEELVLDDAREVRRGDVANVTASPLAGVIED